MALVLKDRVKETTTTTGTGTYTLAGAVNGFEAFSEIGNSNTTYYCCTDGTDFEVGIGTYTASGTTLARTTILQSSNSDNAVNWSSGSRTIFCTQPAEKAVFLDGSGNIIAANGSALTALNASNLASGTVANARLDQQLQDVAGLAVTNGNFIVGDGSNFVAESGATARTSLGLGTIATQAADSVNIDGGAIDAVTLGTNSAITELQVDNVNIDGNSITSTDANGNLALQPNGTGDILLNADTVRVGDNNANVAITTSGTGDLTLNTNSGTNSGSIVLADGANGNISLTPNGTGVVQIDGSDGVSIESGVVAVKNGGTQSEVRLYCESSNAHYAGLKAPAHANFSGNVTSTLPSVTGTLIGTANADAPATTTSASDADHVLINDGGVLKKITKSDLGIGSGSGGDVVDDTSPQLGGDLQSNGNDIDLADNDALVIGTGGDTSIKHDGNNTVVNQGGTGNLQLQHGGNTKLQVVSDGVTITGRTKTDGLMVTSTPIGMNSFNFRYIRLTNLSRAAGTSEPPGVVNFRLNTAADGSGTSYPPNMTANNAPSPYVASGNHVYSSSNDYYRAFDSSTYTRWWLLGITASDTTSGYLQIDLGSSYNDTINRVDVLFGIASSSTTYRTGSYKILGSNTGAFSGEETTIVDVTSDGTTVYGSVTHRSDQFQAMNFEFEGATDDTNELILAVTDPTADRTITLPDATGTVLTTGNSDTPTTTTSSSDADFVLVDDGGTMKKITPANLGIVAGGISNDDATALAIALG